MNGTCFLDDPSSLVESYKFYNSYLSKITIAVAHSLTPR